MVHFCFFLRSYYREVGKQSVIGGGRFMGVLDLEVDVSMLSENPRLAPLVRSALSLKEADT